jgi:hypothetical protein
MSTHPDNSVDIYLDRIDARLAAMADDGEKVVFLNRCIAGLNNVISYAIWLYFRFPSAYAWWRRCWPPAGLRSATRRCVSGR